MIHLIAGKGLCILHGELLPRLSYSIISERLGSAGGDCNTDAIPNGAQVPVRAPVACRPPPDYQPGLNKGCAMCGIVGYVGTKPVVSVIIDGLKKLEYRGYDSAGLAVVRNRQVQFRRASGKLANLVRSLDSEPLSGEYGIGHTRWATHGRPTEENAHPHRDCTGKVAVVHNGIVENYLDLKTRLQKERPPVCYRD